MAQITWEDYQIDNSDEFKDIRDLQDQEFKQALYEDSLRNEIITHKKLKTSCESSPFENSQTNVPMQPKLLHCEEEFVQIRFRLIDGKIMMQHFHPDELISNIILHLQNVSKTTTSLQLILFRDILNPSTTLRDSKILNRTLLVVATI